MMAPPTPGFLSGFVPSFARALRGSLRGKRGLIFALVLALPPIISLKASAPDARHVEEIFPLIVLMLYLGFLAPMTGLLFGSGILRSETSGGTVPYLFTRPVPRSSIVLGKMAAAVVLGGAGLAVSLALTLVQFGEMALAGGLAWRSMVACLVALPAYLGVMTFLSVLFKWGLLGGFLFAFFEGVISVIPGMVRNVSLLFYSQSILGKPGLIDDDISKMLGLETKAADLQTAVLTLLAVAAAFTVATLWLVARKEFVGKATDAA
jgi:ABC-2 type transport system permease protein